jgi:DNA-binding NarL/FixJ family response regulator
MEKLREIDPDVKTIVSSGYSNDEVMANFKHFGFIGVVGKPYRPSELGKALQQILAGSGT